MDDSTTSDILVTRGPTVPLVTGLRPYGLRRADSEVFGGASKKSDVRIAKLQLLVKAFDFMNWLPYPSVDSRRLPSMPLTDAAQRILRPGDTTTTKVCRRLNNGDGIGGFVSRIYSITTRYKANLKD